MNFATYLARLQELPKRIEQELPKLAQVAAVDLAALVKNRVVQKGENADNVPFSPYSAVPVPAFFYRKKSRNTAGEVAVTALGKQGKTLSYKQFRELNGLKTDKKNFEFTGEMWRGVTVQPGEATPTMASSVIQGGSQTVKDKLGYGSSLEKISLLKGSAQELKVVLATTQTRFDNIIKQALNGQ